MYAADSGIAGIVRADVAVVAVPRAAGLALSLRAHIPHRAGVAVVARKRVVGVDAADRRIAGVVRADVAVVADHRLAQAGAVRAKVPGRAEIAVVAGLPFVRRYGNAPADRFIADADVAGVVQLTAIGFHAALAGPVDADFAHRAGQSVVTRCPVGNGHVDRLPRTRIDLKLGAGIAVVEVVDRRQLARLRIADEDVRVVVERHHAFEPDAGVGGTGVPVVAHAGGVAGFASAAHRRPLTDAVDAGVAAGAQVAVVTGGVEGAKRQQNAAQDVREIGAGILGVEVRAARCRRGRVRQSQHAGIRSRSRDGRDGRPVGDGLGDRVFQCVAVVAGIVAPVRAIPVARSFVADGHDDPPRARLPREPPRHDRRRRSPRLEGRHLVGERAGVGVPRNLPAQQVHHVVRKARKGAAGRLRDPQHRPADRNPLALKVGDDRVDGAAQSGRLVFHRAGRIHDEHHVHRLARKLRRAGHTPRDGRVNALSVEAVVLRAGVSIVTVGRRNALDRAVLGARLDRLRFGGDGFGSRRRGRRLRRECGRPKHKADHPCPSSAEPDPRTGSAASTGSWRIHCDSVAPLSGCREHRGRRRPSREDAVR